MDTRSESNRNDYIILILLVLFVVGIFSWELRLSASEVTPREEVLFKAFELLASIAIGWMLQRIQSRDDFKRNIKQFAISAYRRILDIEKAVSRLADALSDDFGTRSSEDKRQMQALSRLVEGISDTVNSSAADWADILNEEIRKKDKIQELEEKRRALETSLRLESIKNDDVNKEINAQFKQLSGEINRLKSELPQMLRSDLVTAEEIYPRSGRISNTVNTYFSHFAQTNSYIILLVQAGFRLTEENWKIITNSREFYFYGEGGMGRAGYTIFNENEYLGFIENPFEDVYVNDFVFTLEYYLNSTGKMVTRGEDNEALFIEGVEVLDKKPPLKTNIFSIKVPVAVEHGDIFSL